MKCKYCGANLKIEDENCPYCGKPNPDAQKHRKDMKHYGREFQKTKQDVYTSVQKFTRWSVKSIILAVLIVLSVMMILLATNSYGLIRFVERWKIDSNADYYKQQLQQMEESGDFLEMAYYYSENNLVYGDKMEEYKRVCRVAANYSYSYQALMKLIGPEDEYENRTRMMENLSGNLEQFYRSTIKQEYDDDQEFLEVHTAAMERMKGEMGILLKAYVHLTDEDLKTFPTLSEARKQVLMEERMGLN